jgi:hypothetical protein
VPTVKLRFYGRFAYAVACDRDGTPTGTISVIAPRFDSDVQFPGGGVETFPKHLTRMSIRRDRVVVARTRTDLPPDEKVLSDLPNVVEADTFVWHLDGRNLSFQLDSVGRGATLGLEDPARVILDLAQLVEKTRQSGETPAALALDALSATVDGKSQAVIKLTTGTGVARKVVNDLVHLVTHKDATDGGPAEQDQLLGPINPRTGRAQPTPTADVVEFTIPLQLQEFFTILIAGPKEKTRKVTVVPIETGTEIVINFTHMCPDLPLHEPYDLEFGRYYNLLQRHPGDQAIVPRPITEGGEIEECDKKARMSYVEDTGDSTL